MRLFISKLDVNDFDVLLKNSWRGLILELKTGEMILVSRCGVGRFLGHRSIGYNVIALTFTPTMGLSRHYLKIGVYGRNGTKRKVIRSCKLYMENVYKET